MFVEADALDVVPRGGLMAEETLIHLSFSLGATVMEIILKCIMEWLGGA